MNDAHAISTERPAFKYYIPPVTYTAPYSVRVCLEYYDYHETPEKSRRKCATFAQVRETAERLMSKYHTGNGVNRVYCEVTDARRQWVPPKVWQAQP